MDGTSSGQHFCLVNEQTQGRLRFEGLAPVMAFRYGFYQNSRYRLDPAEVKRVLHEGEHVGGELVVTEGWL